MALIVWAGVSLATPTEPQLSVDDVTLAEGHSGNTEFVFAISLSEATTTSVKVTYTTANGTATAGDDYNRTRGSVSFAPGEMSKAIMVPVRGDTVAEPDEVFFVNLTSPKGAEIADRQGVGTILNDDGSGLSINDVTVAEGDTGTTTATFTVGLDSPLPGDAEPVAFDIATADGTAEAGADYIAKALADQQIPPGGQFYAFSVEVNGDTELEPNETFLVDLSNVTGTTTVDGQGVGTIANDDPEAEPALSIADTTMPEGDSGTTQAELTVTLSPASIKRVSVLYATADGTATAGSDYQPTNGRLIFARGETSKTVTVTVHGDTEDEPDEDFVVNLTDASNAAIVQGQAIVTIENDDNQPPVAAEVSATTDEDMPVSITFQATDADLDPMTFAIVASSGPDFGTITRGTVDCTTTPGTCTESVLYTPDADANGTDEFQYVADDGHGTSAPAAVSITVVPVDDPPVAVDDTATVSEDDPATTVDVLANDTDFDGGPISITSVSQPTNGTVSITNSGADLAYTPDPDYCITPPSSLDTFTYTLTPGGSTATVSVSVTCADDPPVAVDDAATVTEDDAATTIDVLTNDTDVDGGPISIASVTDPDNGAVGITNSGANLTYTPAADHCNEGSPTDDFTYTLNGGSTATVAITVTCVDDAPVANDDAATVAEDSGATIIDVLANDTDVDGGPKLVTIVGDPANGTATITNSGADLSYEPDADYCNDGDPLETFTYSVTGGSTATVSVTVTCIADPANITNSAGPLAYTENDPATAVDPGVTITNPDGDVLTTGSVTITGNLQSAEDVLDWVDNDTADGITEGTSTPGTVSLTGSGTDAEYTAALAAVTYENTSEDPSGLTRTVTFSISGPSSDTIEITVTPVDDPPVAVDDNATVDEDSGATAVTVLANDTDVDGGSKTIDSASQPTHGTVVVTGGGTGLTYAPNSDYCNDPPLALDTFTYTLTPGGDTATVSMSVTCINDAPNVTGESYDTVGNTVLRVDNGTGVTGQVDVTGDVLANDTDVEGDPLTASIANPTTDVTAGAIATMEPDGEFTYTPPAGATGTDTFTYTVSDGQDVSTGSVTVTLKGMVWYVDNTAAAGGLGRSADPFDTLADAQTASTVGNTIYVRRGSGATTGQAAGITLKGNQRLLGEGVALTVPVSVNGGVNPTTLRAAGLRPLIDNTAVGGNGVTVGNAGVEILGLDVAGAADGIDITSSTAGPQQVTITDTIVRGAGVNAIDVNTTSPAGLVLSIADNRFTAAGNGLDLDLGAGTATTITHFADNTIEGATGSHGVLRTGTGTLTFDAVVGGTVDTVTGGVMTVGTSGDPIGGAGIVLGNVAGSLAFSDLDVFASGTALQAAGTGAGLSLAAGGGGANATLSATGGPALNLASVAVALPTAAVTTTNSPTNGISLTNVTGSLSTTPGSSITNSVGSALAISGGTATVTFPGVITNGTGRSVDIQNRTAGTVTLSGAISDTGSGVLLNANTGSTIGLSGPLTLSTGTNPGFTATGGGTVTATNTTSTISTTFGTALNVANTTIGSGGLKFRSISSNGAPRGIVLNTTGATAGLTVSGTGGAGSGGTIQNSTASAAVSDAGIQLVNTRDVNLASMNVTGNAGNGIYGSNVTNLTLNGLTVSGNTTSANADLNNHAGLRFDNLVGTATMTSVTVANHAEDNARIVNSSGTLTQLTISGSTFRDTATASPGNNGLLIQANGTATITADVTGSSFLRDRANGIQVVTNDAGTVDVEIGTAAANSGGTFTDNNIGVNIAHNSSGNLSFDVRNGSFSAPTKTGTASPINVNRGSFGSGTMSGTVSGNTITNNNSLVGPGIRVIGNGPSGTMTVKVENNTISQVAHRGIDVLARDGNGPGHSVNVTIRSNTVTLTDAGSLDGIRVDAGSASTDTTKVCADIAGNTASTIAGQFGIRVRQRFAGTSFTLEGYAGSATDNAAVAAYLNARNTSVVPGASADHGGAGFGTIVNCPEPS